MEYVHLQPATDASAGVALYGAYVRELLDGERMRPVARWAFDVAVAMFVTAITVPLVLEVARELRPSLVWFAVANATCHAGSVVIRRRLPVAALAIAGVTALVHVAIGLPVAFLGPPTLVVLFTLAARRDTRTSAAGLAAASVVLVVGMLLRQWPVAIESLLLYLVLLAGAWFLGDLLRRWKEQAQLHAERAQQLEAAREELARFAVTQERLRIARDLHDVVAHRLTGIAVHASTARLAMATDPDLAGKSVTVIEQTTRETLAELRHLMGVLRDPDTGERKGLAPLPTLGRLNVLVSLAVDAGLTAEVSTEGEVRPLPAALELAIYRVAQEAVTNVVKHAHATRVQIILRYRDEIVELEVVDDGRGPAAGTSTGHGLLGMAERTSLFAGRLTVGGAEGGGFRVHARFPTGQGR